jgi:hypothetical protein
VHGIREDAFKLFFFKFYPLKHFKQSWEELKDVSLIIEMFCFSRAWSIELSNPTIYIRFHTTSLEVTQKKRLLTLLGVSPHTFYPNLLKTFGASCCNVLFIWKEQACKSRSKTYPLTLYIYKKINSKLLQLSIWNQHAFIKFIISCSISSYKKSSVKKNVINRFLTSWVKGVKLFFLIRNLTKQGLYYANV